MTIYDIINYAIPVEMKEAMGECAYQRLLFCCGLFTSLLPYILTVGFTAFVLLGFYKSFGRRG